jgi:hypothetical protein
MNSISSNSSFQHVTNEESSSSAVQRPPSITPPLLTASPPTITPPQPVTHLEKPSYPSPNGPQAASSSNFQFAYKTPETNPSSNLFFSSSSQQQNLKTSSSYPTSYLPPAPPNSIQSSTHPYSLQHTNTMSNESTGQAGETEINEASMRMDFSDIFRRNSEYSHDTVNLTQCFCNCLSSLWNLLSCKDLDIFTYKFLLFLVLIMNICNLFVETASIVYAFQHDKHNGEIGFIFLFSLSILLLFVNCLLIIKLISRPTTRSALISAVLILLLMLLYTIQMALFADTTETIETRITLTAVLMFLQFISSILLYRYWEFAMFHYDDSQGLRELFLDTNGEYNNSSSNIRGLNDLVGGGSGEEGDATEIEEGNRVKKQYSDDRSSVCSGASRNSIAIAYGTAKGGEKRPGRRGRQQSGEKEEEKQYQPQYVQPNISPISVSTSQSISPFPSISQHNFTLTDAISPTATAGTTTATGAPNTSIEANPKSKKGGTPRALTSNSSKYSTLSNANMEIHNALHPPASILAVVTTKQQNEATGISPINISNNNRNSISRRPSLRSNPPFDQHQPQQQQQPKSPASRPNRIPSITSAIRQIFTSSIDRSEDVTDDQHYHRYHDQTGADEDKNNSHSTADSSINNSQSNSKQSQQGLSDEVAAASSEGRVIRQPSDASSFSRRLSDGTTPRSINRESIITHDSSASEHILSSALAVIVENIIPDEVEQEEKEKEKREAEKNQSDV